MRILLGRIWTATLFTIGLGAATQAADFHFPVGISYAAGYNSVIDRMDENWRFTEKFVWPLGVSFNPYVDFGHGLGVGASLGPAGVFVIDSGWWDSDVSYIVPLGLDVRYNISRNSIGSPYVRVGFRYPVAGGEMLRSSDPGWFGAVGVEFFRKKKIGFGAEIGYDGSKVEIRPGPFGGAKKTTAPGVIVSAFVLF